MKQPKLLWLPSLLSMLMLLTILPQMGCKKKTPPPVRPRVERPKPRPTKVIARERPKPPPRPRLPEHSQPPYFDYDQDRTIYDMAQWLASHVTYTMMKTLRTELAGGSTAKALEACRSAAGKVTEEFGKKHNATIQRISHRNRNPANLASSKEMRQIRKLKEKIQNDDPNTKELIKSPDGSKKVVYLPILITVPTCLKCHGQRGKDIEDETLAMIKKLYPKDRATGFKIGDVRGLWKVTFQKN